MLQSLQHLLYQEFLLHYITVYWTTLNNVSQHKLISHYTAFDQTGCCRGSETGYTKNNCCIANATGLHYMHKIPLTCSATSCTAVKCSIFHCCILCLTLERFVLSFLLLCNVALHTYYVHVHNFFCNKHY